MTKYAIIYFYTHNIRIKLQNNIIKGVYVTSTQYNYMISLTLFMHPMLKVNITLSAQHWKKYYKKKLELTSIPIHKY